MPALFPGFFILLKTLSIVYSIIDEMKDLLLFISLRQPIRPHGSSLLTSSSPRLNHQTLAFLPGSKHFDQARIEGYE